MADDRRRVILAPGEVITDPARAEQLGLTADARRMREEGARCESCGSTNLEFDGWDIDKCCDCGHWRYR